VVWCGVVWCGVVWCGVVWCGVFPSSRFGVCSAVVSRSGRIGVCSAVVFIAPYRTTSSVRPVNASRFLFVNFSIFSRRGGGWVPTHRGGASLELPVLQKSENIGFEFRGYKCVYGWAECVGGGVARTHG
jgi:hypothetical protein